MAATAADSLSDVIATGLVLISMIVLYLSGRNIDGICGVFVALFIIYEGITAAKDTVSPLLGQPPTREFVDDVLRIVKEYPEVLGTHDLVVHDYGPGRIMLSLHAEVSGDGDIYKLHDCIDRIERELKEKLGCEAVIHMDPVDADNENVKAMCERILTLVQTIYPGMTIHDFRMVPGDTHTNLIFDVTIPPECALKPSEVEKRVKAEVKTLGNYEAVITVDMTYV